LVGDIAAFQTAQAKYKISDERLGFDWFIVTRGADASVKALRERLPALLVLAETKGFVPRLPTELLPGFNFLDGEEPHTSLDKEGVWILSALPASRGRSGMVFVKPPAQGGAIGLGMVTTAVEAELNRADNLAKLATVSPGERCELFVWLDEGTAGMALVTPRILPQFPSSYPTDGPVLPGPVTCVWAATGPSDRDVLARAL